jgi:hypothetical protein
VATTSTQATEQTAMAMMPTTVARRATVAHSPVAPIAATVAGTAVTTTVARTSAKATAIAAMPAKQAAPEQTTMATMLMVRDTTTSTVASPPRVRRVLITHHRDGENRKEYGDSPEDRAIHLTFLQNGTSSTAAEQLIHSTRRRRPNLSEEKRIVSVAVRCRSAMRNFNGYRD